MDERTWKGTASLLKDDGTTVVAGEAHLAAPDSRTGESWGGTFDAEQLLSDAVGQLVLQLGENDARAPVRVRMNGLRAGNSRLRGSYNIEGVGPPPF